MSKPTLPFVPAASSIYKGFGPKPSALHAVFSSSAGSSSRIPAGVPQLCMPLFAALHAAGRYSPLPLCLPVLPVAVCSITSGSPIDDGDGNATGTH